MKHLRAALHAAVDLVLDAIEKDRGEEVPAVHVPAPVATRASRRGAGLRLFHTDEPVNEAARATALEFIRRKGISRSGA